jgi:hypothetical protein
MLRTVRETRVYGGVPANRERFDDSRQGVVLHWLVTLPRKGQYVTTFYTVTRT